MSIRYKKLHNQNYKELFLQHARKAQSFHDEYFPPIESSLWKDKKLIEGQVEWKRCKEICSNPHLLVFDNGKFSHEVVQGAVGNCWLVSALGLLAAHPPLLEKVIPKWALQDWVHNEGPGNQLGVYHWRDTERHPGIFRFRFYRFGQWIEVVVDDYLPTINGRLIYAHSKNPNEMWCALLEKAYAKLCGCYEALEAGSASDALVDLTGSVPETIELHREDAGILKKMDEAAFICYLLKAAKKGALMSCSINALEEELPEERLPNGLIIGHTYGITEIQKLKHNWCGKKEVLLLRLHNPWGEIEWNGLWSDKSSEWARVSEAKRKKLELKVEDDGDFWMAFEDFIANFSTLVICRNLNTAWYTFGPRWHSIMYRGIWSLDTGTAGGCINNPETFYQNPQFALSITKPTVIIVALMQEDHRGVGVENLTIGFVCLKIEENRKYRIHKPNYNLAGKVTYINAREVTGKINLEPGRFIIIPSTYNRGEEGAYFLRIFSSRRLKVNPLLKDSPRKRWYHPILYWGKSNFVGMVRLQVVKVQLKRELSGYIKIIFGDMNNRIKQQYLSSSFKKTAATNLGNEYVFYIRDPNTAEVMLQLFEIQKFRKDQYLGEIRVGLDTYSKSGKQSKLWEITKTLTKIAKVPQSKGLIATREVETPETSPYVKRRHEALTAGFGVFETGAAFNEARIENVSDGQAHGIHRNNMLASRMIDAGIGQLQIRISYFGGVNS
ncbi:hypothetical protein G9A89_014569 [Geosiphon pyriformis]|nr:hypothetical protein G9A89_014569 [Geosiphon pyriformis]